MNPINHLKMMMERHTRRGGKSRMFLADYGAPVMETLETRELMSADGLMATGGTEPRAMGIVMADVLVSSYQTSGHSNTGAGQTPGDIAAPDSGPHALLLPAVQKVREAAARMKSMATSAPGAIAAPGSEPVAIGLLLPAVQKVREAAARMNETTGQDDILAPDQGPQALLLPAVQKVREAAARSQTTTGPNDLVKNPDSQAILIGLLLPAVQKVR